MVNSYIAETRSAVRGIFDLLANEKKRLAKTQESYACIADATKTLYQGMQREGADSADIVELYGLEASRVQFSKEIAEIRSLVFQLSPTYNALAAALLQIAKQGISSKHGGLSKCPNGRLIGQTEFLKNVIWQGRNQTMHYEEGQYRRDVNECFTNLVNDFGWDNYVDYEKDMETVIPG
jgi:hypothetical protein